MRLLVFALLVALALTLGPPSLQDLHGQSRSPGTSPRAGTVIFGSVLDRSSGEPIPGAAVLLLPGDPEGQPLWSGATDEAGRFRTESLSLGRYRVAVEYLGFSPLAGEVVLEDAGEVDLRVQMVPVDFALDPVIALAVRRSRLEQVGFYDRLEVGIGHFVTREELVQSEQFNVSEVLREVPGVRVFPGIARANRIQLRGGCLPRVVLDGLLLSGRVVIDDLVSTYDIEALEVYHGASAPILYTGETTCGVVMIWTRDPGPGDAPPGSWRKNLIILGFTVVTMLGFR